MKSRTKVSRSGQRPVHANNSFVVPSHGRLVRRGSTAVIDDPSEEHRDPKDWSGTSR
jgi:hypothetical protein